MERETRGQRWPPAHVSIEKEEIQFRAHPEASWPHQLTAAHSVDPIESNGREKTSTMADVANLQTFFLLFTLDRTTNRTFWSKSPQSWKEFFFGRGILSLSLSRSNKEVFVLVCTEASIERSSMTFQDPPAVNILKFMRRIYVSFFSSLVFLSFFFFPRLYNSIAGRASVTVSIATMKWIKIRQGIVASNDLECETRRSI